MEGPRFAVHNNGSLEIYGAEKDDAGQYTCLAKNTEGPAALNAMLYVKGKQLFFVFSYYSCKKSSQWLTVLEM